MINKFYGNLNDNREKMNMKLNGANLGTLIMIVLVAMLSTFRATTRTNGLMNSCRQLGRPGFRPAIVLTVGILAILLVGTQTVSAQPPTGTCMDDVYDGDLTCKAKEVYIAENPDGTKIIDAVIVGDDDCAFRGDTATVNIIASIHFNADRYDIGVYSAADGGDAYFGACYVDILPFTPSPLYDADGSPDVCGDVDVPGGGDDLTGYVFQTLTLSCEDEDEDGLLDFGTCFSWRTKGNNELCEGPDDVYPGTPSKCFCERVNIPVPVPGQIIVDKVTDPSGDLTSFDFTITGGPDSVDLPFSLTDAATPYESEHLYEGTYQVLETVPPLWEVSASCTNDEGTSDTSDDTTFLYTNGDDIILGSAEIITCTFTDTYVGEPQLEVVKTVTTSGGSCPGEESITVRQGDTVKYCYDVLNPGTATLYDVTLWDDHGTPGDTSDDFSVSPLTGLADLDGEGDDGDLAAGGTANGSALVEVYTDTTNIASGTGVDIFGGSFSDSDIAQVVVINPSIDIRKNIEGPDSQQVVTGGTATFEIAVTNTGDLCLSGSWCDRDIHMFRNSH